MTKADLVKLGLDHLMGTPMLRAYMHGFFIDNRLYEKAKVLTDPFAYETYRQQRIQKKLDEERQSRISLVKKLPKVSNMCLPWWGTGGRVVMECEVRSGSEADLLVEGYLYNMVAVEVGRPLAATTAMLWPLRCPESSLPCCSPASQQRGNLLHMQVNAKVAAKLLAQQADTTAEQEGGAADGATDADASVRKRRGELVANPLADDRFKAMFEEEDFVVDEESAEYRLLHPNVPRDSRASERALVSEHFEQVGGTVGGAQADRGGGGF